LNKFPFLPPAQDWNKAHAITVFCDWCANLPCAAFYTKNVKKKLMEGGRLPNTKVLGIL